MYRILFLPISLILFLFSVAVGAPTQPSDQNVPASPTTGAPFKKPKQNIILFSFNDKRSTTIAPVVILNTEGRLERPPMFDNPPHLEGSSFPKDYYSPGTEYFFAGLGKKAGTVRVETSLVEGACSGTLNARVAVAALNAPDRGLVANVPLTSSLKRDSSPNPNEIAAVMSFAKKVYSKNGFSSDLLEKIEMQKCDVLTNSKQSYLVASLMLPNKGLDNEGVWLFFILEKNKAGQYDSVFTKLTDAILSRSVFVDTIDLDNDGADEIILNETQIESHIFHILKISEGKFVDVYTGGGDGC